MNKTYKFAGLVQVGCYTFYDEDGNMELVTMHDTNLASWGIDAIMPAGFKSDGMSVPRFFWRFISPKIEGRTAGPSIIHDWLYASHRLTRKEADNWLRQALVNNGMTARKAAMVYYAVRVFGFSHW